MLGSTTAPSRPGACDDAPVHVAFRSMHSVGVPGVLFSRLNTQPMRTPVNASPSPSRGPTHDSGTAGAEGRRRRGANQIQHFRSHHGER